MSFINNIEVTVTKLYFRTVILSYWFSWLFCFVSQVIVKRFPGT